MCRETWVLLLESVCHSILGAQPEARPGSCALTPPGPQGPQAPSLRASHVMPGLGCQLRAVRGWRVDSHVVPGPTEAGTPGSTHQTG